METKDLWVLCLSSGILLVITQICIASINPLRDSANEAKDLKVEFTELTMHKTTQGGGNQRIKILGHSTKLLI